MPDPITRELEDLADKVKTSIDRQTAMLEALRQASQKLESERSSKG